MSDKAIAAMTLALEALEDFRFAAGFDRPLAQDAIDALREALAQPQAHQVSAMDFVEIVEGREEMIGLPVYWAQWPTEAKK